MHQPSTKLAPAPVLATESPKHDLEAINETDLPEVMRAKFELLGRDSPLAFELETTSFSAIGGLGRLQQWLEVRKSFFADGAAVELDPPRGVLLLDVQGCGKSFAAKAVAGIFGVPLLRLDFGVLYNKHYGETERNLRKALETAAVMSPCVLWMDEIEKGLAVGADDDGLARRILGALLTWMSERRQPEFVVATANDLTRLPPERGCAKGAWTGSSLWICRRRRTGGAFSRFNYASAASIRPRLRSNHWSRRPTVSPVRKSSRRSCRRCTLPTPKGGCCRNRICWRRFSKPVRSRSSWRSR